MCFGASSLTLLHLTSDVPRPVAPVLYPWAPAAHWQACQVWWVQMCGHQAQMCCRASSTHPTCVTRYEEGSEGWPYLHLRVHMTWPDAELMIQQTFKSQAQQEFHCAWRDAFGQFQRC